MQEIKKYSDVRNSFNGINVLENWQFNCLMNYGNTVISKKHFDERIVNEYYEIFGKRISLKAIPQIEGTEVFTLCEESLINKIYLILGKWVKFRFVPRLTQKDSDCYIIECIKN